MKKYLWESLIGKKFGTVNVLSFSHFNKGKAAYVTCLCDCSSEPFATKANYVQKMKTCKKCIPSKFKETKVLTTSLKVLRKFYENKKAYYECECTFCQSIFVARVDHIKSGSTKSCKCNQGINFKNNNPMLTQEGKKSLKKSVMEKYGVENVMKSSEIKERLIKSNIEIYGSGNYANSAEYKENVLVPSFLEKEKELKDHLLNNGYEFLDEYHGLQGPKSLGVRYYKQYKIRHIQCGSEFIDDVFKLPICKLCYPKSQVQAQLAAYIRGLNFKVIDDYRDGGSEIDIFLPDLNIGFEYNGLYFHSMARATGKRKNTEYHYNKSSHFLDKGIRVFHIWGNDDLSKVKSRIRSVLRSFKTKIYARDCSVSYDLDIEDFVNRNHLKGHSSIGNLFTVSLVHQEKIVAAISIRKFFNKNENKFEIARYAIEDGYSIVGGFSRLLHYIKIKIKEINPEPTTLITYCDIDWSPDKTKTVYAKYFKFEERTSPSLFYTRAEVLKSREHFQKHKLEKLFPDSFSPHLSADEILAKEGWHPLYKCGNWKYSINI